LLLPVQVASHPPQLPLQLPMQSPLQLDVQFSAQSALHDPKQSARAGCAAAAAARPIIARAGMTFAPALIRERRSIFPDNQSTSRFM
jgi:hypothetical protein